jgi:hypothetical protein
MFKKAILNIYYRLFDMHSRGEDQITGAFLAVITISIVFWLYLFSIIVLLKKIDVIPFFLNKTETIALGIFIIILDYFLFMHKKKYEKIIQIFKDESNNERRRRRLFALLYVLLSVVIFVLITFYKPGKL